MKPRPNCVERRPGQREDLPDDRADEDETRERSSQCQAVERKIAEPATQPWRRACNGLDVGTALTAPRAY